LATNTFRHGAAAKHRKAAVHFIYFERLFVTQSGHRISSRALILETGDVVVKKSPLAEGLLIIVNLQAIRRRNTDARHLKTVYPPGLNAKLCG
jgi:hypothetical protein